MLTKFNKVWEELTTAFLCRSREEGGQGMRRDPEKLNDQRVTLLIIQMIEVLPRAKILDRTKIQIQRPVAGFCHLPCKVHIHPEVAQGTEECPHT